MKKVFLKSRQGPETQNTCIMAQLLIQLFQSALIKKIAPKFYSRKYYLTLQETLTQKSLRNPS